MREIYRAVFRDDPVASALASRHYRNLAELIARINPGNCEPRIFSSSYAQHASGWRVVEIIHAVSGVYG